MRQIKFRGKRVDNGEWVYGFYVSDPLCNHRIYYKPFEECTSNTYHFVDPATVSQFTGFMDKNGKEIWEGDVIWYYQPYSEKWENHICQWDDKFACFGLFEVGNKWCKESDWMKIQEIEVIGNIHDSPSLTNH